MTGALPEKNQRELFRPLLVDMIDKRHEIDMQHLFLADNDENFTSFTDQGICSPNANENISSLFMMQI
ncbi:MAG: hypothetical protein LBF19_06270 [Prevotellaceae bacterium]|nr:hypothetical protein [Prevotellaceae bacterium]